MMTLTRVMTTCSPYSTEPSIIWRAPHQSASPIDAEDDHLQNGILPVGSTGICNKGFGPVARRLADVDCAAAFMYAPGQVDQPEVACLTQQFGRPADFLGNLAMV